MKDRKLSIKDKLIIYLVFLSVTAIFIVSLVSYLMAKDALIDRTFNQLTSIKTVKNRHLQNFFQNRINDISIVKNTLKRINNPKNKTTVSKNSIDFLFDFLHSNSNIYKNALFYNPNKSTFTKIKEIECNINALNNNLDSVVYNGILFYYTDMINSSSNESPSFFIGIKQNIDSPVLIVFEISATVINKLMLEDRAKNGLGNSGETYLVGDDFLMRSSSKFQENSILKTKVNTIGVNRALKGISGSDIFLDYRGTNVFSSYERPEIPFFNWVLMVEIDEKEALSPIIAIRNYIIFVTIFISFIVLILAIFISQKFSKPIIKLNQATSEIGQGNYSFELERTTSDEIGDLTDAFNTMTINLKEKNKELEAEKSLRYSLIIDAQEKERERLSRELHDGLGQLFTALKLNLENYKEENSENQESIDKSIKIVDNAIDDIRKMSNDLMPSILKEFGLISAIENLCKHIEKVGHIKMQTYLELDFEITGKKKTIYIFRIIQEALNNIIKHAKAEIINLELFSENNEIYLNIKDNGIGFKPDEVSSGNGIYNIKERVQHLNGEINIKSENNAGVEISIIIPK